MGRSTKYTLGAALEPGIVVYNSTGTTVVACDADTDQATTSALLPLGPLRSGGASGDEAHIAKDGEFATFIAGGAIADGDLLTCLDGGSGTVVAVSDTTIATLFADGDPIYIIGIAQESASSGTGFTGLVTHQLISASEPA